ncbi:hypothetical protein B0H19DRAFT_1331307 [Mycena capillaripes]|nr:hypothetical protein B0H19DRAFT_1331307 [Mycena capillaripes]
MAFICDTSTTLLLRTASCINSLLTANTILKRHIETHNGEKPHLCDCGCGKAVTRKNALKRHQDNFILVFELPE